MTRTYLILGAIVAVTLLGDYALKLASNKAAAFLSPMFIAGAIFYALSAAGWLLLMKTHNLAQIGALYSSVTLLALTGIGYFVFKEEITGRQVLGLGAALLAVYLMETSHPDI